MAKNILEILDTMACGHEEFVKNMQSIHADRVKHMIDDAMSLAIDLHDMSDYKDKNKTELNIANAFIVLRNAYKFDKDDAKLVSKKYVTRLIDAVETIDKELHRFCYYLRSNLCVIEKCHEEDDKEDNDNLESLSKEELITRLREKSK